MKRATWLFVQDIIEAIDAIESHVGTTTFDDFKNDKKTLDSVVWEIHVIGEATKNIPKGLRGKYPDIPWREMAGMRDRIVHFYFGIDHDIVWNVLKTNLPTIKNQLKRMLTDLKGPNLFSK